MKLRTKLTLFNTLSKLVIATIFVLLLPALIKSINQRYNDNRLLKQQAKLLQIINPGDSFQSSSDPRAHFGLGKLARYESIQVLWPDGLLEVFPGGDADKALVLQRGEGRKAIGTDLNK